MEKINVVFCVLTYKNTQDLKDLLVGLKKRKNNFSYKVIVINSFYDSISSMEIKKITKEHNCDLLELENLGYSYGNNKGIEYAFKKYDFNHLIVSNADVEIIDFDYSLLEKDQNITAPEIVTLNYKLQNPLYFNYMPISEKLVYHGFKKGYYFCTVLGIILNKMQREILRKIMKIRKRKVQEIYAPHGSFIIFSKVALEKLMPVFDEDIFLFCEENELAVKSKLNNVKIKYDSRLKILHKEDGSMNLSDSNTNAIQKESYIHYYEKWNEKRVNHLL